MATSSGKVSDSVVSKIIDNTIAWARGALGREGVDVEVLRESWLALRAYRRTPEYCSSYDLAAAEHYMYAAFAAANSGDPTMQLAPPLYALKKKISFLFKDEASMRTDPRFPVLPPDDDIDRWGTLGARFGLETYRKLNPGQPFQYGAAVGGLMTDAGYGSTASRIGGDAARKLGAMLAPYIG